MKRLSIVLAVGLMSVNLQSYDKGLEKYINKIVEKKLKDYKRVKEENKRLRSRVAYLEKHMDKLEDSIESVETKTLVDKVNFGVGFESAVNNYDKKYADNHKKKSNNLYTTKLSLNMKAKIAKNMKFTGRLSMYKYWADSTKHMYSGFDNMQGRVPSDSTLYVERAYVDWKFLDDKSLFPTDLTIGRQPSSDGPSYQFKENTTRKSTYSALIFDGAVDGAVFTTSLKNATPFKNTKVRFAYCKGFQNDQTNPNVTNAFIGADNSLKDTNVYGFFVESPILGRDDTLFQLDITKMKNVVGNAMDSNSSNNVNLGDITFAGMLFEGTNINNSGLDLFAHFAMSKANPSNNIYKYGTNNYSLLGDGSDFSKKTGRAFWIGGRYTLKNKSKIGFEYNQGSKNWISMTQGSNELINKLATRGKAYEAYYIYPINRYSFLRFGGVRVDYDYTHSGWYLGEPKKFSSLSSTDKKGAVKAVNNIYLKFGLRY